MGLAAIGEGGVNLIGEHQQVVALHHPGHRLQVCPAHDSPCGVVGIGQNQQLCLVGDFLLQLLGGEAEAVFRLCLDDDRHTPRHFRNGHIAHKAGLGDEDLVPGLHQGAHAQVDGFAAAHGDQHLVLGVVLHVVVALDKVGNLRPKLEEAPVWGVAGAALLQALDARLPDVPGGVEIGLAHREGNHVVHLVGDVEELPNARGLDPAHRAVYQRIIFNHKGCSLSRQFLHSHRQTPRRRPCTWSAQSGWRWKAPRRWGPGAWPRTWRCRTWSCP